MVASPAENTPVICPKTDEACDCPAGPEDTFVNSEVNGVKGKLAVKKCGQVAIKETYPQRLFRELSKNIVDDI